ncbi:MAG: LamG-like jellyroll fold domain-containing protein, partial [Cyclobacteriaceae bacterium]
MKNFLFLSLIALCFNSPAQENALNFDGANDHVIIQHGASLNLDDGTFTIEYWAQPETVDGNFHWVLGKSDEGNNATVEYLSGIDLTNKWRFALRGLAMDIIGTSTVVANQYYHIACVFDGSEARLYVNGSLDGTATLAGSAVTGIDSLIIGARNAAAPTQFFDGSIDEVRFWNTARTQEEIVLNAYFDVTSDPDLITYYKFNEGTAGSLNTGLDNLPDQSSTNDGTLINFSLSTTSSNWVTSTAFDNDVFPPIILSATTHDNDLNGQIDLITVIFSEDLDGASVTDGAAEFTLGGGYTILSSGLNGTDGVDIVLNESGIPDTDLTPAVNLIAATLTDLIGNANSAQTITPTDEAAPGFLSGNPTATAITLDGFTLDVEVSEAGGQVAYSILANPSSAPASLDDVGTVGVASGIISTPLAETAYQEVVTGLSQGTSYDIYLLPYDGIGNRQVATTDLLNITTAIPMSVTTTTPNSSENNVAANSTITINFDTSLDGLSLTDANIKVRGSQSGVIPGSYLGGGTSTLMIDPVDDFLPGEVVTVTITDGVIGLSGEIASSYSLSFTIATAPFEGAFIQDNNVLEGQSYGRISEVGDYDGDGDLDIMIGGFNSDFSSAVTSIYQNTGGTFTDITAGVIGTTNGRAKWGDYDGDGDLDLVVIGNDAVATSENSNIYRNDGGTYVNIGAALTPVEYGSVSWGDYDNDGDLDLFLSGMGAGDVRFADIYENNAGVFTPINAGIVPVNRSAVDWGDYDNDGDLDLVIMGASASFPDPPTYEGSIYRNDNGTFIDIGAGLPVGSDGMLKWGDYDNDNDLDLLYAGSDSGTSIFRNDGGVFIDINAGLTQTFEGMADWGDYDGDGDLDILMIGNASGTYRTFIYRNDGGNTFNEVNEWVIDIAYGGASWGDFDGDGDLDIVVNGETNDSEYLTLIYENTLAPPKPLNATGVTTAGFTPHFEVPTGATDIIVDVSTDPAFGSFIAQNISVGTPGGVNISTPLSIGTEYYYRAKADYGGTQSTYFASKAFMVQPGNALSFTGNKHVDIYDDEINFNPTGDFTIEFWFNTTKTGNFIFFEKDNDNTQYSVQQFSGDVIGLNVNSGTMQTLGSYNDGTWHHVAIIYRGANDGVIYVDGVNDTDTGSITLGVPNYAFGRLSIGDRRFGGSFNMEGSIDELRLWEDERTLTEIVDNQLNTLAGSEEGLLVYYTFDKTSGLLLANQSTQMLFDGDLTNMDGSEWVASGRPVPPPTLTSVSIGMDPTGNPNYARPGDIVDIAITASENITNVTASLFSGGNPVTNTAPAVTGGPVNWNIRYAPTGTDTDGIYTFTIDFESLTSGAPGTQVASVTDGSFVILDQTEPVITATSLSADNATLTIDFDEEVYADSDGLSAVALGNFSLSQSGGVATATATAINVVTGSQVELALSISGDPDGNESITVDPVGVYNGAGIALVATQSNNTVNLNDNTPPTLSGISVTSFSDVDADIDLSIDEASTLYYVLTQSAVQPTAAQIILGEDENSVPAIESNNNIVASAGPYNFSVASLSASTTYFVYCVAEDASGNQSNVLSTSFTTNDPPVSLTYQTIAVPNDSLGTGTLDNLIYKIQLDVSGGTATMIGMFFTPNGTYVEADFDQFNFYESVGVDDFSSANLIGSNSFFNGDPQIPDGSVGIYFDSVYTDETVYWYVTADISASALVGNTFGLNLPTEGNFGVNENNTTDDTGLNASNSFNIVVGDTTPPTVTISSISANPTNDNPILLAIAFSEVVSGLTLTDFTLTNGTLSNLVDIDGNNYTAELTPTSDGSVTVDLGIGAAQDGVGNDNIAATQFSINYDGTAPSVVVTTASADPTSDNPIPMTITFIEEVNNFNNAGLITVTGATLSNLATSDSTVFTVDATPTTDGVVSVSVAAGVTTDLAGTANSASNALNLTYDGTAPSVVVTTASADPTSDNPIPVTITFSEEVNNFNNAGLITVTGATLSNLATSDSTVFTVDAIPTTDGVVSVSVAAGATTDLAGTANNASNALSLTYDGTGPAITFDQDGLTINDTNLSGTTSDTNDVIQISIDAGTTLSAVTNNGDGTWTYDLSSDPNYIGDGAYSIYLDAIDSLGNQTIESTGTVTIDQTGPVIAFDQDGQTTNDTNISGTVSDPTDVIQLSLDAGTTLSGVTNNSDGTWSYDLSSDPNFGGDGAYSIYLNAMDTLGNQTINSTGTITIDQTAPNVEVDIYATSIISPQITGTIDDLVATIEVTVNGETNAAANLGDGTWLLSAGVLTDLTDGTYDVSVSATDLAGNVGADQTIDELVISQDIVAIAPTQITATSFRANWSEGLDVLNYELDVSTESDFSSFLPGFESLNVANTNRSFVVTGLDFATSYYYRVRLVNTSSQVSSNSNTRSVKTIVDSETLADSLALVQIHNAINPQGLNWGTARLRAWDGVTLDANRTRVNVVNISSSQSAGDMPNPFTGDALTNGGLSNMTGMDISVNEITGLMDFSTTTISTLLVNDNMLEFDDIEPLVSLGIGTLDYTNQGSVQYNQTTDGSPIEVRYANDYTLSLGTNGQGVGGSANDYVWFRNDVLISSGTDFGIAGPEVVLQPINYDNMGEFRTEVTSSLVPGLVIEADRQIVWAVADMVVSVVDEQGDPLEDPIDGYMLEAVRRSRGFDTLEVVLNAPPSTITFPDVVLGNYITAINSNPALYIPTYFGDVFEWGEADTLFFRSDDVISMIMTEVPRELTAADGNGSLDVLIEEDFGEEGGRIDARRRAAKRKCGLRRKRSGGRIGQDDDDFELIAYGETDDNGEFQFGFLPQGTYRFFVEYPGIPLDESSFVEFEVGEEGVSD